VGRSSVEKGKRAERALVRRLRERLRLPALKRRLGQDRDGGEDLEEDRLSCALAIQVKHRECGVHTDWWVQAVVDATDRRIPVLAYRRSRKALNSGGSGFGVTYTPKPDPPVE
jgi:hypothetical protein